jgi:hypothetical protein
VVITGVDYAKKEIKNRFLLGLTITIGSYRFNSNIEFIFVDSRNGTKFK